MENRFIVLPNEQVGLLADWVWMLRQPRHNEKIQVAEDKRPDLENVQFNE